MILRLGRDIAIISPSEGSPSSTHFPMRSCCPIVVTECSEAQSPRIGVSALADRGQADGGDLRAGR